MNILGVVILVLCLKTVVGNQGKKSYPICNQVILFDCFRNVNFELLL